MEKKTTVIRINELKLRPDHTGEDLRREIGRVLRVKHQNFQYEITRQSIDARKKPEIYFVYTVDVEIDHPQSVMKKIKNSKISLLEKQAYQFPYAKTPPSPSGAGEGQEDQAQTRSCPDPLSPVVVGSGPAGLFCALMLARAGLRPLVLERGQQVEKRVETVKHFWETGELNPQSNVQFGEGGAGTFSDGKLNTQIKDPGGKIRFVLQEFVKAGANPAILYQQKPHIGTDVLVDVVTRVRREIEGLGGKFLFDSCLTKILPGKTPAGRYLLEINGGQSHLPANQLVLALGHSARDTVSMLYDMGMEMAPKAFAVGLRIQHPQSVINEKMYGKDCPYDLGAAPYKLTHRCEDGRGVYSFCMCPGGYVVNASSEEGRLAVNGMSYSDRSGRNANSALVVTVTPEDYGGGSPLSGMEFQRRLEERAYLCGQGKIPVQRYEDYGKNVPSHQAGSVVPQMRGGYHFTNLRQILPETLNRPILEGMEAFGRQIPGFDDGDAILAGVESRTSSPVKLQRDGECQAPGFAGIFPCGEGAGYAGGITSAAVDGIRVAEAVCGSLSE